MKRLLTVFVIAFLLVFGTIAFAEEWNCSQCGNAATGKFCSNCGISAEESLANESGETLFQLGMPVTIDDVCEFVIEEATFIDRLDPQNPAMAYSYYEADAGKKYFCLKISYMNLESDTVSMQGLGLNDGLVSGELIYADHYKYSGFLCYEQDLMGMGGSMTSAIMGSIDPLCTETMYYLIEVPETVSDSTESVSVIIKVDNNEYELVVR